MCIRRQRPRAGRRADERKPPGPFARVNECCLRQHAHERVRMQAEPTWKPARGRGARAGEGAGRGKAVCRQGQRPQPWLRALRTAAALQRPRAACVSRIEARRCSNFCSRNNFVTPSARSRTSTKSTGPRRPRQMSAGGYSPALSASPPSVPVLPPTAPGSNLADFALRDYHQVSAGRAPTRFRERRRCTP